MPSRIEETLRGLGMTLPTAAIPAADYVPYVVTGKTVWISGQLPMRDGTLLLKGKLGQDVSLEHGQAAAQACALNLLAQVQLACEGDLDRLGRCLKLVGFVAGSPDFTQQHLVINGASSLIRTAMGDAGRHARSAVGVASLPFDAPVEVEGVFELL